MNQADMRLRRGQVLLMLMDGLREEQIGRELGISQSSVSRDLKRLDGDAEEAKKNLARLDLEVNTVWLVFQQLDKAVEATLKTFDGTGQADPLTLLTELRLLLKLLGRKCYLLRFAEIHGSLAGAYLKHLERQYVEMIVRLDIMEEKSNAKLQAANS